MLLHASAGVLSKEYWERSCALPNLEQVTLTKGYGAIADNVVFGYQWAAGELSQESSHPKHGYKYDLPTPIARAADYVMNVDSDMLVTADFFVRMAAGYERARELCVYPVISGYTSNLQSKAYGPNFVFNIATYYHTVREIFNDVGGATWEERHGSYTICDSGEADCLAAFQSDFSAWDDRLGQVHEARCGFWPLRDENISLMHHMVNAEGIHYDRDGALEMGLRFPWDEFNLQLKTSVDPVFGNRILFRPPPPLSSHQHDDDEVRKTPLGCFAEAAQEGVTLAHCAADENKPYAFSVDDRWDVQGQHECTSYRDERAAKMACLALPTCGGVSELKHGQFELRAGPKLIAHEDPACPDWRLPRSWLRRSTPAADPAYFSGISEAEAENGRRQRCVVVHPS